MAAAPLSTGRKMAALRGRSALSLLDSWACTFFSSSYSCRALAVNGFSRRSGCLLGQNSLLHRERQLAPRRQVIDRDRRHPFDPPVAAKVWRDQPNREAVSRIERHAAQSGRDQ